MYESVFIVEQRPFEIDDFREEMERRRISTAILVQAISPEEFLVTAHDRSEMMELGTVRIEFYLKAGRKRLDSKEAIRHLQTAETDGRRAIHQVSPHPTITFASLGQSMSFYRRIVQLLRPDAAMELLISMRDLMALKYQRPHSPEINNAALNRRLLMKLAQTPEETQIYIRGHRILNESEAEMIRSLKPEFRMRFTARSGHRSDVDFRFGTVEDLGARAAILIGKNGIGKTHFLREIANLMLAPSRDMFSYGDEAPFRASRLICFFTGPRASKAFPRQTSSRRLKGFKVFNLQNDPRTASISVVNAVKELITSDESIADLRRFEIFQNSVRSVRKGRPLFVWHEELGPIDLISVNLTGNGTSSSARYRDNRHEWHEASVQEFSLALDPKRGMFSFQAGDLSSGEEAYVRFCVFASLYIESGSAVLMDEPEVYLHPQYIDALMGALHRLLEITGSVAFISTHSAYVVRCAEEHLVFLMREPVHGSENGFEVEFTQPRMRTYGADVGLISLFVFGEDEMATTEDRARAYAGRITGENSPESMVQVLETITSPDLISRILASYAPRR